MVSTQSWIRHAIRMQWFLLRAVWEMPHKCNGFNAELYKTGNIIAEVSVRSCIRKPKSKIMVSTCSQQPDVLISVSALAHFHFFVADAQAESCH